VNEVSHGATRLLDDVMHILLRKMCLKIEKKNRERPLTHRRRFAAQNAAAAAAFERALASIIKR
jgi:hypothetical protein